MPELTSHGGTMAASLRHQWRDTICGGGAYGCILGARGVKVRLTVEIVGVVPMQLLLVLILPSLRDVSILFYDDDDDDNDDEESTIPLNEVISQIPPSIAITPVLPIMEPEDSLIMGDGDLSTIPENECDLPFCDNFVTFSYPLFNDNDAFTSSDDESLPGEDVSKENFKIYSSPLFEFNDEYISSDVNPVDNP
ncbi:hypothetical protein Tco_0561037 [Tanacetum coccineum]